MAMTPYNGETLTIANIGTTPQERAMDTSEFKMAFSKDFHEFVEWFNETHNGEINKHMAESVNLGITGIRLNPDANLNSSILFNPGTYYYPNNGHTMTNAPTTGRCKIIVEQLGIAPVLRQTYIDGDTATPLSIYQRYVNTAIGTYGTWEKVITNTEFEAVQTDIATHKAKNATGTQKGHVILASSSETELGTEATKAVTPAGLKEALDKRPSLIDNRIPVPSGADMNDYITPGNYRILDVATAATLLNYPSTYGGTLEVWRYTSTIFIQRLITSTTGVFYQRICVNGVWYSWNMTYNTTNVTVSTSAPVSALAEGFQHQVY
jgi:hypothetical protein